MIKNYKYDKSQGRWVGNIRRCGVNYYIGSFKTEEEAAKGVKQWKQNNPKKLHKHMLDKVTEYELELLERVT